MAIIEFSTLDRHFANLKWIMIQQIEWLLKDYWWMRRRVCGDWRRIFSWTSRLSLELNSCRYHLIASWWRDIVSDCSWINFFMCSVSNWTWNGINGFAISLGELTNPLKTPIEFLWYGESIIIYPHRLHENVRPSARLFSPNWKIIST